MSVQQIESLRQVLAQAEEKVGLGESAPQGAWSVPAGISRLFPEGLLKGMTIGFSGSWVSAFILAGIVAAEGAWTIFLGCRDTGWECARSLGINMQRVVTVPRIQPSSVSQVVSAAFDGFDVVIIGKKLRIDLREQKMLSKRALTRGVLLLGEEWNTRVHLQAEAYGYNGLASGGGYLESIDYRLIRNSRVCNVRIGAEGWSLTEPCLRAVS